MTDVSGYPIMLCMINIDTGKATNVVKPAAFNPSVINTADTTPPVKGGIAAITVCQSKSNVPRERVNTTVPKVPVSAIVTARH